MAKRTTKAQMWAFIHESVESETDECVLWPFGLTSAGYGSINIDGVTVNAHRAALLSVSTPIVDGLDAAHGPCHNRLCINVRHLSWKTRSQNIEDTLRDGTRVRGTRVKGSKLDEESVLEIRRRIAAGEVQKDIAALFGISPPTVSEIKQRKYWSYV